MPEFEPSTNGAIGGQVVPEATDFIGGHGPLPPVPTNEILPTNGPSTIDERRQNWQTKRGWIEWTKRKTKTMGVRRYPRRRRWEWDEEKEDWVKSTPIYSLSDYDPVDEENYVKIVERRERARKLGF